MRGPSTIIVTLVLTFLYMAGYLAWGVYEHQQHHQTVAMQDKSAPIGNGTGPCVSGNGRSIPGCTAPTPTPSPTPTATPAGTVTAYHPSTLWWGTATNGGGGGDCSGSPCVTPSTLQLINVRYMEGNISGTFNVNGTQACNNGTYCYGVYYNQMNNVKCDISYLNTIYNDLNSTTNDAAWNHYQSPATAANRSGQADSQGTSSVCASNTRGVYGNPGDKTDWVAALNSDWFQNATYINGSTKLITRWDNSSLIDSTVEYGNSTYAVLQKYITDYVNLFSGQFPSQLQAFNAFGTGGGNYNNNNFTGTHLTFACSNHVCNDPDDWCLHNAGNIKYIQGERPLVSGNYPQSIYLQHNLPYMLDTAAQYYNDTGCNSVDIVELEPVNDSRGDNRFFRDTELAVRMLMEPGNYDGTQGHRAFAPQRYNDCVGGGASCNNQIAVYPEDGLQFVPATTMAKFVDGGGDGNGCHTGDSGGAASLKVACVGTDDQGYVGAVYGRPGQCYKYGTDIGKCFVLLNQSNQTQTISNTWCQVAGYPACNTYPYFWHYNGTGPQNCYEDIGLSNSCSGGIVLTPSANGGGSSWGESSTVNAIPGQTTAMTLGACPGPIDNGGTSTAPTVLASDCSIVLLSQ